MTDDRPNVPTVTRPITERKWSRMFRGFSREPSSAELGSRTWLKVVTEWSIGRDPTRLGSFCEVIPSCMR